LRVRVGVLGFVCKFTGIAAGVGIFLEHVTDAPGLNVKATA
jgi:hypothetical protein